MFICVYKSLLPFTIYNSRFIIVYLISLSPLWLIKERRVMEIFFRIMPTFYIIVRIIDNKLNIEY
jgi:hypothetical protein